MGVIKSASQTVGVENAIIRGGYIPVNSFEKGSLLTSSVHALRMEKTNEYFVWLGVLPKSVSAGSTPETLGGFGPNAWNYLNHLTLRPDLSLERGASIVLGSSITCKSLCDLLKLPTDKNLTAHTSSYHIPELYKGATGTLVGGSQYVYDNNMPKKMHNGGNIISDTVPWNGMYETHTEFMKGLGEGNLLGNGCWVDTSNFLSSWKFGVYPFNNDGKQVGRDATFQFQMALYAAKLSQLTSTHSVSLVSVVNLSGPYTFLISGRLYYPEGVYSIGDSKIPTKITFGWSDETTKISGYGVLYDLLKGNPAGTTFTKNWGIENVSLIPHYVDSGPTSCTYIDSMFDIELHLSNVRFVMHKGAVGGGQLNATGVMVGKGIDYDWQNVTMDGGAYHLRTNALAEFGLRTARVSRFFSYNAKEAGVYLDNQSADNEINYKCQMPEQVGLNRTLYMDASCSGNNVSVSASGSKLKYGAVVDGTSNTVSGIINGGSVAAVEIRGLNNDVRVNVISGNVVDNGVNSTVETPNFAKSVGVTRGRKRGIAIPTPGIWSDIAEIILYPSSSADLRAASLTVKTSAEVLGIGRDCYYSMWLVRNKDASQVVEAVENSLPFNPMNALKIRVLPTTTNKARIQIQVAAVTGAIGVRTVDVIYQLDHDQYSRIATL